MERQYAVTSFSERTDEETRLLGVWEETWNARARLAGQAERYRVWLREQGCSRDQAATMTVHFLLAREPDNSSNVPVIH
jgi:aminoglycoside phosphotransferase (APT) family kinase protein